MRTHTSLGGLTLISLTTLLLLSLSAGIVTTENSAAGSRPVVSTIEKALAGKEFRSGNDSKLATPAAALCPFPTISSGTQCVLTADVVLDRTLVLQSNTTLDCQRHKLRPKIASTAALPPQVGIFLNHVRNVRIKECDIEGFDFGIFAINSKRPTSSTAFTSFTMTDNRIKARYTGVSLISVDNAVISNNKDISYTRASGRALYIGRNSDSNRVVNNTFVADLQPADDVTAFRVPGPESNSNPKLPSSPPGAVVVITQIEGQEPTLLNAVVNGELFQLKIRNTPDSSTEFSRDNTFVGNVIRIGVVRVDGIALTLSQASSAIGNKIEGAGDAGIRIGMQNGIDRVFPGKCASDPSLDCLDGTCPISGAGVVNKCKELTFQTVNWISRDIRIEENEITGTAGTGVNTTGQGTTITGNTIAGPPGNGATGIGIRLIGKHALESSIVMRNSVSKVVVALSLIKTIQCLEAFSFESRISLNDFTNYGTAVLTSKAATPTLPLNPVVFYNLKSELSVGGQGNFWDTSGCLGLDPSKVRKSEDDSLNPLVIDSHPFGIPVARKVNLPNPCPFVSGP